MNTGGLQTYRCRPPVNELYINSSGIIAIVILAPIVSWKFNKWNYKPDSELEDAE